MVEYNSVDNKAGGTHKYKLFDVAMGNVVLETNGRSFFGQDNNFIIIDDKYITIYAIASTKATVAAKFNVSEISKAGYKDLEFVGLSKKRTPFLNWWVAMLPCTIYIIYLLKLHASLPFLPIFIRAYTCHKVVSLYTLHKPVASMYATATTPRMIRF
ncbi:MAG: hypothetical protein M0D57_19625 [Sphingobacteriales bacterium JAD_PAG50586_3]|nr:MAG: hypothetical protein M0D57_19625 [Sphingobacteriales bacterium JAD_PAG50586_3]